MSKALEKQGIEVDAYRSPEDDTLVVYVDTPGIDENEKGPLIRLYLNDDPVYENPEYPFSVPEPRPKVISLPETFAELAWRTADVTALEGWDPDWGEEAAEQFLREHQNQIRDRLCERGYEVMDTLLDDWRPEVKSE